MAFSEVTKPGITAQAEQVEEQRSVITPNGAVTAEPGDWEVRYSDGNVRKFSDDEYREEFGDSKTATTDDDEREDSEDVESEEEDIVSNGTPSDKESAEDSTGDRAESDETRPAPPPRPARDGGSRNRALFSRGSREHDSR